MPSRKSTTSQRLLWGVGLNDSETAVYRRDGAKMGWTCPVYRRWASMLSRCYSENYLRKQPTYRGCTVAETWHTFSVFRAWMQTQSWEGRELDKDILAPGNKVYGPDTCCFVSHWVNHAVHVGSAKKSACPPGVDWIKRRGKFRASITRYSRLATLGYFATEQEASYVYRQAKRDYLLEVADKAAKDHDERICEALRRIALAL